MKEIIFDLIEREKQRQDEVLEMIPSENYAFPEVLKALCSCLTNKYAEGYPGKRYYQGSEIIDLIESLAIQRVKNLFNVPFANVQPYSGSPANHAVYLATCNIGDTAMGMDLFAGGHLTHGSLVSFSGKYYRSVFYDVDRETGLIDYDEVKAIVEKEKPKLIWCGATAYPRFFDWEKFAQIAESVRAYLAADISHYAGLVAGGSYPTPIPYADIVTFTTHKTLRGPRGAVILTTEKGNSKDKDLAKRIDKAVFPGLQGGPHENTIAAMAICFDLAGGPEFKEYARQVIVNASVLAGELIKYGFSLVTGGTDCHLILIDLGNKNAFGRETAVALEKAGIVCNANSIPYDSNPPFRPSGIRLGTPAITARGMKEEEMKMIAGFINRAVESSSNEEKLLEINNQVKNLTRKFPVSN